MIKREDGFSLVELLVSMAVFVVVMAAATGIFVPLLNQAKQQSRMVESNIQGILGLELLRVDLENAGYGLPWSFQNSINYSEAVDSLAGSYNDSPSNPPRAIASGNNVMDNGSDYLVVKSTIAANSDDSQRWSYIVQGSQPKKWGNDDLQEDKTRVIVVKPKSGENTVRELVMNGTGFFTKHSYTAFPAEFSPATPSMSYMIYGVNPDKDLRMPFNRADYYISTSTSVVPPRCAANTGVLQKGVISQANGKLADYHPLLDCVADMQVAFGVDTSDPPDGRVDCYTNDLANVIATTSAQDVREKVKDIMVYLLVQEGQFDSLFTFNVAALNTGLDPAITCDTCVRVGERNPLSCVAGDNILGRDFDLSAITNWKNYRWKVYILVVKPANLG